MDSTHVSLRLAHFPNERLQQRALVILGQRGYSPCSSALRTFPLPTRPTMATKEPLGIWSLRFFSSKGLLSSVSSFSGSFSSAVAFSSPSAAVTGKTGSSPLPLTLLLFFFSSLQFFAVGAMSCNLVPRLNLSQDHTYAACLLPAGHRKVRTPNCTC